MKQHHALPRREPSSSRPRIERFLIDDVQVSVAVIVAAGSTQFFAAAVADGRKWETTSHIDEAASRFRQGVLAHDLATQLAAEVVRRRG